MIKKFKFVVFGVFLVSVGLGLLSCEDGKTPDSNPIACLKVASFQQSDGLKLLNAGTTYNFIRQINNEGPADANNITLRYYLSTDENITDSDVYLNFQETLDLSSGSNSNSVVNLTIPSSVTPGKKYYIGLLITTSSCTNNCPAYKSYDVTITDLPHADDACLSITQWYMSSPLNEHTIKCGRQADFYQEIVNNGSTACTNIEVRYYISADNDISTDDTLLGIDDLFDLAPGSTYSKTVPLRIPKEWSCEKTYYIGASITSSSCQNKCVATAAWEVYVLCADKNPSLTVPTWHLEYPHFGTKIYQGFNAKFHREIKNVRDSDCSDTTVRYYLGDDFKTVGMDDIYLGVEETLNIPAGSSSEAIVELPIPNLIGDKYMFVSLMITSSSCVNSIGQTNDLYVLVYDGVCLSSSMNYGPGSSQPTNVNCGQVYTFYRSIRNRDWVACDNITIRYYLSTDCIITSDDIDLGVEETLALPPQGVDSGTVDLVIPAGLAPDIYHIGALVTSSSCKNRCAAPLGWDVAVSCPTASDPKGLLVPEWNLKKACQ